MNDTNLRCSVCGNTGSPITKGRRASPGCAVGPAAIVTDPQRTVDVPSGAVLVIPMTDPDCVPVMTRSAAIVTDRGGAMCHAALVARELKKPCVVGTQNATAVCKDGQRVRVCANRGLVVTED